MKNIQKAIKNLKFKMITSRFAPCNSAELNKNSHKGVTLVEIIVVIFVITLFSAILISDFPKVQRQFALSRVTYKLAQDLRKTEDLGLSGVPLTDRNKQPMKTKGYGIYIDLQYPKQYIIYADVADINGINDFEYTGSAQDPLYCSQVDGTLLSDCAIEVINIAAENPSLEIINNGYASVSINFNPPNPTTTITAPGFSGSTIGIILSNGSLTRTVQVNTSGLINVFQ